GTGKSHTITAIIFDTILKDKSVLVLSDKKEALDVVEKNIENTLNKVRVDEKFQNPLLRLGKTGNNYGQLLTQDSIDGITQQFRAVRSKYPNLNEQIDATINALKNGLDSQVEAYKEISLSDINELASLTKHFDKEGFCIDIDEAIKNPDSVGELARIRDILIKLKQKIRGNKGVSFNFDFAQDLSEENSENFEEILSVLENIQEIVLENPELFKDGTLISYQESLQKNKTEIKRLLDCSTCIYEIADTITKNGEYTNLINVQKKEFNFLKTIEEVLQYTLSLQDILAKVRYFAKDNLELLHSFEKSCESDVDDLEQYINSVKQLRSAIFGYLGKSEELDLLNQEFRKKFTLSKFDNPHKNLTELESILSIYKYILELRSEISCLHGKDDVLHIVTSILKDESLYFSDDKLNRLHELSEEMSVAAVSIKEIGNDSFIVSTLHELNNIAVITELNSLHEELNDLMMSEKELIESNIDLGKNGSLEILLQKGNLSGLICEISACKEYIDALIEINDDVEYLKESSDNHKCSFAVAGIDNSFNSFCENRLTEMSDLEFEKLLRLITLNQRLISGFDGIKDLSYESRTKQIEN
ncbi:MAG: hypothetical protein GYA51_00415, partial [Candidatus Methanofastidiosa archaeon]|nr:hypothetical protein [Candidatus Methanofastidiosa archaeon]